MSQEATISVIIRKDKQKTDGTCPLFLRVTKDRKRNYVSLGLYIVPELWDEEKQKIKPRHTERLKIEKIIDDKVAEYKDKMLDFKALKKGYTAETLRDTVEQPIVIKTVWDFYQEQITRLKKTSPKTANAYAGSRNSLRNFYGNRALLFSDIDARFLKQYENWMREKQLKETSMSAYLRSFRALFNLAVEEKIVRKEHYPFNDYKVSRLNTDTMKRAITKEEMYKIINLPLEYNSCIWLFRQYFVFMYYGQGINFKDMALLTWRNLDNDRIRYFRAKTDASINFKLSDFGKNVIESFRGLTGDNLDNYIFPILDRETHVSVQQIQDRVDKVLKHMNRALKEIGELVELSVPLTTYVARHTYATVLAHNGADVSKISQAMGHTNLRTTQIYLKSFQDSAIDDMNELLL